MRTSTAITLTTSFLIGALFWSNTRTNDAPETPIGNVEPPKAETTIENTTQQPPLTVFTEEESAVLDKFFTELEAKIDNTTQTEELVEEADINHLPKIKENALSHAISVLEPSNAESPRLQSMFSICLEESFTGKEADYEAVESTLYANVDITRFTNGRLYQDYFNEHDIQHRAFISVYLETANESGKDQIVFFIMSEFHTNDFNQFLGDNYSIVTINHNEESDSFSIEVKHSPSSVDVSGIDSIKDPETLQKYADDLNKTIMQLLHHDLSIILPKHIECLYDTRVYNEPELEENLNTSVNQLREIVLTGQISEMNLNLDQ